MNAPTKSVPASLVLKLMDKDYTYCEALKTVLKYWKVDRIKLEKELNKYI